MFVLGHIGIGEKLVCRLKPGLPARWIYFGALLPDLIDKPLFYSLVWWTGKTGDELGLISGTRTFGHTGILILFFAALSLANKRSTALNAAFLGLISHALLDFLGDPLFPFVPFEKAATLQALTFPVFGFKFYVLKFTSPLQHLDALLHRGYVIAGEIIGLALLIQKYRATHSGRSSTKD